MGNSFAHAVDLVALAAWWGILAVVSLIFGRMAAVLFRPFADSYKAKWALLLLVIGLGLMILSACFGLAYYTYFT